MSKQPKNKVPPDGKQTIVNDNKAPHTQVSLSLEERQRISASKPEAMMDESGMNYTFDMSSLSFGNQVAKPDPLVKISHDEISRHMVINQWRLLVDIFPIWRALAKMYPLAELDKLATQSVGAAGNCWFHCIETIYNGYYDKPLLTMRKMRLMTAEMVTAETVDAFLKSSKSTPEFPASVILRIPDVQQRVQTTKQIISKIGNDYWGESVTWTHLLSRHPTFVNEKIGLVTLTTYWKTTKIPTGEADSKGSPIFKVCKEPEVYVEVNLQKLTTTSTLFYVINLGNNHYQMLGYVRPAFDKPTPVVTKSTGNQKQQKNSRKDDVVFCTPPAAFFPHLEPFMNLPTSTSKK